LGWQPRLPYRDLLTSHPHGALDTAIQPARWVVRADSPAEGRAQKTARLVRLLPEVDADERFRMKRPRRLFQRLAYHGIDELLALFDVAGRLVEHHAVRDALLDEQKLPVALDDGGDGEIGTKDHEGNITG